MNSKEQMNNKIICEKCGAVMVPIDPDKSIGMKCPKCGWGWVTSYIEPKLEDETLYTIILDQGNQSNAKELKAVSTVAGCNYIQAKSLITESPYKLIEGLAIDIESCIEMLDKASVKYHVEPEWPYQRDTLEPSKE